MPASTRNSHVQENNIQLTLSTTSSKSKLKLTGKTKQNSTSARYGITLPFTRIVLHGANTTALSTFRRSINGATQIESASKIFTPQATARLPSQPSRQQQRLASAGYYHFDQLGERSKTSVHILLTKQFHKMNKIEPAMLWFAATAFRCIFKAGRLVFMQMATQSTHSHEISTKCIDKFFIGDLPQSCSGPTTKRALASSESTRQQTIVRQSRHHRTRQRQLSRRHCTSDITSSSRIFLRPSHVQINKSRLHRHQVPPFLWIFLAVF